MSCINSLDKNTIHRICSGQVIINLANAVKELIENSLDAGSKSIEIKLKQYGSDLIEVADDGPGIVETDYQTITLKHYTSKINSYDDLESLETFGFRGEALSSLCALSNLTITTRHASSIVGNRLEYDKNGILKSKSQCARSIGTTVSLEKLFHTLPVRHKEFIKNLKKEYTKLIHVIQCYCIISEGVKLSFYNIIGDKTIKIMSTHSKNNLKENIIEIFGISCFNHLVKFIQAEPDKHILEDYNLIIPNEMNQSKGNDMIDEDELNCSNLDNDETNINQSIKKYTIYKDIFQIEGFISNCSHNQGRSAPDRQYLYVNKRPCDHSKITKILNELFHQYNRTQYPMFILNINMNTKNVDVNVTPDKLKMFIKNENALLAVFKASILKLYDAQYKNMNIQDNSFCSQTPLIKSFFQLKPKETNHSNKLNKIEGDHDNEITCTNLFNQKCSKRFREEDLSSPETFDNSIINNSKQMKILPSIENTIDETNYLQNKKSYPISFEKSLPELKATKTIKSPFSNNDRIQFFQNRIDSSNQNQISTIKLDESFNTKISAYICELSDYDNKNNIKSTDSQTELNLDGLGLISKNKMSEGISIIKKDSNKESTCMINEASTSTPEEINMDNSLSITQKNSSLNESRSKFKIKIIKFNFSNLIKKHKKMITQSIEDKNDFEEEREMLTNLKFKTKNIESNEAESELDRCITKDDFLKMKICGQFNKGFIITKLDNDLFIVDQHAADEIYNFEKLQKTGKIEKQKLIQPKYLELSASMETILIDNLIFLEKFGYEVQICTNRKVGNRIMLTCVPMSSQSNKILNLKDIDELLFVLSENELNVGSILSSEQSNLTDLQSSSLRSLFASKACRKSVMIGDSLNINEMKRIVTHLNEIDKPWNCPHGRPTMRHLINIDLLKKK